MTPPAIVDERAQVHPAARLGRGVEIGPWTSVGAGVVLADGVKVGSHCVLDGDTVIGEGSTLSSHVVIGSPPQDLKYAGEPTRVRLGARNQIREFTTINRGTVGGGGLTEVGDENLFMTGAHVAHDCHVGNRTVFANQATLAGHVIVGDFATVGAFTAVHQFCRVGRHAFLGGFTVVTQDVLPFMKTVGARGDVKCYGPNRIGLVRKGVTEEAIDAIGKAFRVLRGKGGRTEDGMVRMLEEQGDCAEVRELVLFLEAARVKRGFHL